MPKVTNSEIVHICRHHKVAIIIFCVKFYFLRTLVFGRKSVQNSYEIISLHGELQIRTIRMKTVRLFGHFSYALVNLFLIFSKMAFRSRAILFFNQLYDLTFKLFVCVVLKNENTKKTDAKQSDFDSVKHTSIHVESRKKDGTKENIFSKIRYK